MLLATTKPVTKACRAFTLIEMLIVLVILGSITVVAIPRFAEAQMRYESQLTARKLAGELEKARAYARANRMNVGVVIAPSSQTFRIKAADNTLLTELVLGGDDASIHSSDFRGSTGFVFDGFGSPSNGGTLVVEAGGWFSTITVDSQTGEISYSQTPGGSP